MSDRFLPIGKYNPPTSGNTYQVPSQHITHEPGNLEFYEVLTRNQAVQTQVKSAQPAQQSIVQPSRGTSCCCNLRPIIPLLLQNRSRCIMNPISTRSAGLKNALYPASG